MGGWDFLQITDFTTTGTINDISYSPHNVENMCVGKWWGSIVVNKKNRE